MGRGKHFLSLFTFNIITFFKGYAFKILENFFICIFQAINVWLEYPILRGNYEI